MRIILVALLVACAALFAWRGPVRAVRGGGSYDLVWMYSASRAWATGGDPYDIISADDAFVDGGGPTERLRYRPLEREAGVSGLIYPPTTFVVMAPIGLLPWKAATVGWSLLNLAAFGAAAWSLLALAGLRASEPRGLLLLAACLAFGPVHTSLAFGQTAMLPTALVLAAQVAANRRRYALAGAALAVACALKPQLAGFFIVLEAMRGRWRVVFSAAIVGALIAAAGAGALWSRGIDWPAALRSNLAAFQQSGVGSPTSENWLRFQMINLQYPLHELMASRFVVNAQVWAMAGALLVALAVAERRWRLRGVEPSESGEARAADLLSLVAISCVSLMVVYHRYYDATLLLPALAWVAMSWGRASRGAAVAITLLTAIFAVNGTAALYTLGKSGGPLENAAQTDLWRIFLMPHQAWAALLLGIVAVGFVLEGSRPGRVASR